MDDLFTRFWKSVLIFWGGLHMLGAFMVMSDADTDVNPVWPMMRGIFQAEFWILKIVVLSAVLWAIVSAAMAIRSAYHAQKKAKRRKQIARENVLILGPDAQMENNSCTMEPPPKRMEPEPNVQSHIENLFSKPKLLPLAPPALTAEELKEKALKSILGRY